MFIHWRFIMLIIVRAFILTVLLYSYSSFAINQCGTDAVEKKYPLVTWEEVVEVNVNSSLMNTVGILCIGRNKNNLTQIERITYRDNMNNVVEASLAQLTKGTILLKSSDMPAEFSIALRDGNFVSLKTINEAKDTVNKTTRYQMSMRILRNLSIGFSANDYREILMTGIINWQTNQMHVEYTNKPIDLMVLNLSTFPVNIQEILFYDLKKLLNRVNTLNLKNVPGLL